ncbi:MAG: hypothetical protein H0T95_05500, partial [Chthoniobacterales bacterium]|nr:hypothetical protein [Chthoniobacterales bacterium]
MRATQSTSGTSGSSPFQKVGECLYRYLPNGVYYARLKSSGKEIRRSLRTADQALAKRNLAALRAEQEHIDRSKGKLTLREICETYRKTIQHQKPKTIERKTLILGRLKTQWPSGSQTQVAKIKPSDVRLWLSRYNFGAVSRNLHLACLKDVLQMAVDDGVMASSPAAKVEAMKLDKPIRTTPRFEDFKMIVADIRSQKFNADAGESADFVEFLGHAGLGQAEATALRWSDVDWERERIITFRHKTKSGFAIPLYPQLRPVLQRRYAERKGDRVFDISNAKKAISAACKRLGLPAYSHR